MKDARILAAMQVRQATAADARAVHTLLSGIYKEGRYFVNDDVEPFSHLEGRISLRQPRSLYLVAVNGTDIERVSEGGGTGQASALQGSLGLRDRTASQVPQVVGWLELHRSPARRLQHVAVLTLAVAPQARRQGVGRALLRASYPWCGSVGVRKMSLNVRASNQAAVQLYLSEGFVLEGRERNHVRLLDTEVRLGGDGYEDNLIMGLWFE